MGKRKIRTAAAIGKADIQERFSLISFTQSGKLQTYIAKRILGVILIIKQSVAGRKYVLFLQRFNVCITEDRDQRTVIQVLRLSCRQDTECVGAAVRIQDKGGSWSIKLSDHFCVPLCGSTRSAVIFATASSVRINRFLNQKTAMRRPMIGISAMVRRNPVLEAAETP